jgi:hypothetical protein
MPAAEMAETKNTSHPVKRTRVLGFDLHSWEQWMLWSLAGTALAAVAVMVTTAAVVLSQREENARTKAEFESYKLGVEKETEGLRKQTAEANARAAEAKLALEKFKADRFFDPRSLYPKLHEFSGVEWDMVVATNDFEAERFSSLLSAALGPPLRWVQVPWKGPGVARQIGSREPVGPVPDFLRSVFSRGVLIAVHPDFVRQPKSQQLMAAKALVASLKEVGIDCDDLIGAEVTDNSTAVHIVVGHK